MTDAPRGNLIGGSWLLADLSLNIWSLSLVKWLGADYPPLQVVFVRALVGLLVISPLIWRQRHAFSTLPDRGLHLLRILLAAVTLTASFFALARLPLAVFSAMSFTRPILTMLMVAAILREVIGPRRWIAAGAAMVGILIAVNPGAVAWNWGLAAMVLMVVSASTVVVVTRRLRDVPPVVMMAFYTVGLTVFSAPFALYGWHSVPGNHIVPLLLIGCFAQAAQFCFLRAHFHGAAGYLSVLSYLSLVLSVGAGYFVFDEVPGPSFAIGAVLVVGASLWVTLRPGDRVT